MTIAADTEAFRRENQQERMTGEELRTRNGDVEEEVMIDIKIVSSNCGNFRHNLRVFAAITLQCPCHGATP